MDKKALSVFRGIIFFVGIVVILVLFISFRNEENPEPWRYNYFWVSIAVSYLVVFFPVFFPPRDENSSGGVFSGFAMYIIACGAFVLVSILLAILVSLGLFKNLTVPLSIQLVIFFFFLIEVYLSVLTTSHISDVAKSGAEKRTGIVELRNLSGQLTSLASALGDENASLKNDLAKLSDDLRYLSPSSDTAAVELENKMFILLKEIIADPVFSTPGASNSNAVKKLAEVTLLFRQRKTIY
ncbi:MAG: hypothetical protein IAA81_00550 [Spirochaetes bacterium]|uniref:Uncharacterized protein n=1 Tax=Candidatus Gallitreponema excrementavium TaxID=2840840 RepID=A0A9D9HMR7_9SPIR|nr:hypothetical protein [Candidatus Gallitreponema excrementavium]